MAYNTVGRYTTGVWLVKFPNGTAGLYQRGQLPKPDGHIMYYWVGATQQQIDARITDAMSALGVTIDQLPGGITGGKFGPASNVQGLTGIPGGIASAITSAGDFLSFISWIFHPVNLLRAVEFVTGIAMMAFGVHTLMRMAMRSSRTHRTSLRSLALNLFPETRALRRGRRAGRRDAAYNQGRRQAIRDAGGTNRPLP